MSKFLVLLVLLVACMSGMVYVWRNEVLPGIEQYYKDNPRCITGIQL